MSIEREGQLPEAPPLEAHTAANRRLNRPYVSDAEVEKETLAYLSQRLGLPRPAADAEELFSQLPPLIPEQRAMRRITDEEVRLALKEEAEAEFEIKLSERA